MSEIRVGATYFAPKEMLFQMSMKEIKSIAEKTLSHNLADFIVHKSEVFESTETKDGIRFSAECYVLTPKDFENLVIKIQKDLLRFGTAPMLGGVSA